MIKKYWILFFVILMVFYQNNGLSQSTISFATTTENELLTSQQFQEYLAIQAFGATVSADVLPANQVDIFFEKHFNELSKKIKSRHSDTKKASIIFDYLHDQVFKNYKLNARVSQLINQQTYNCVTATSLFVSYAEAFGIPYKILETPAHVYASIIDNNKEVIVELTAPKIGFNLKLDYQTMVQVLIDSKLISRDEVANIGAKQVYEAQIKATKAISKKELLAIQYHNDALIYAEKRDFLMAYNQMNKAHLLYPSKVISEAYSYIVSVSQLDFTLSNDEKYNLLNLLLSSTKSDSLLTYTFVNHLGELTEDLLKEEENFNRVENLLLTIDNKLFMDNFIQSKLDEYNTYMFTVFAQIASLKGNTIRAKNYLEQALQLSPSNKSISAYYVSVSSAYALKLSQTGLFKKAEEIITSLEEEYPTGFPIIPETKVQIILDSLVPIPKILSNKTKLLSSLQKAHSLSPDNIYLKSFAADVFHELAMQEIRRANYNAAKSLVLEGLSFDSSNQTLRSDLQLINDMIDK